MIQHPLRDPGSFRDPSGYVFHDGERVIRAITESAWIKFENVYNSGIIQALASQGLAIDCRPIDASPEEIGNFQGARSEKIAAVFEHPRIPFISYPYEWVFPQLKDAALAHLDLQIAAFERGFVLSDATAYNMQFLNGKPLHIDTMSLRRYEVGQVWDGYNQFCRQFLLPLLLEAWGGVNFQAFYRGSLDGISFVDAMAILPRRKVFTSPSALMHVFFHGRAVNKKSTSQENRPPSQKLGSKSYLAILQQLRDFIAGLQSKKRPSTYWSNYANANSYSDRMKDRKLSFVKEWASTYKPETLLDIGGNTGEYSCAALEAGCLSSVLLDSDADSVATAYQKHTVQGTPILPLLINVLDPTPAMGWRQKERSGLASRARADGVVALAVIHHLVLGGNLPLDDTVNWIMERAPNGVIEFVPKQDPMVAGLLSAREDIYTDYSEDRFRQAVSARGRIVSEQVFEENGRLLIAFESE